MRGTAAAAARDLLASESSGKTKRKRNKRKKKADTPEPSAANLVDELPAIQALPPCSSATMGAEAAIAPSVEATVPDRVQVDELKLLEAMGWSDDLNVRSVNAWMLCC